MGAAEAGKTWYFAEGCTRLGFEEWICLLNPSASAAMASCDFMTSDGQEIRRDLALPATSRTTLDVASVVGSEKDVSLAVTADTDIVAERPMYFRYHGVWSGGHDVMGSDSPKSDWYFAEGCCRDGFDTWLCIANPSADEALIDIRYYCGDGISEERSGLSIAPHSRFTVPVHETGLGLGRSNSNHGDFSMRVSSTNGVGVVAERPMYFSYTSKLPEWRSIDRIALAKSLGTGEIFNGNAAMRRIALTFDIEGDVAAVSAILDVLQTYNLHCTFFVLGSFARAHPDIMKRIADEGHEIGNHSYSHKDFTKISLATAQSEIAATEAAVRDTTGLSTCPYFRFPYGSRTLGILQAVNTMGYISVYWNIDPQDYASDAVYSRVVSAARPGAIVVMHGVNAAQKASALPGIIQTLRASGYELVTVTELLFQDD
jgi:peptidoglycan/xylan/chitin deacetylase (PgdA/CDA1 family)